MNRTAVLIIVLIVLGLVAVFVWNSQESSETAPQISQTSEVFVCSKCGAEFNLTLDESTAMYQKNAGITCPKCNELGANKRDVKVFVGGLGQTEEDEQPVEDENAPKEAVGGLRKISD